MKHKIILMLLVVLGVVFLSSCSYIISHVKGIIGSHIAGIAEEVMSNEERAAALVEEIVSAFNAGDREAMRALFSEKAQSECEDLDDQIDQMFSFIQGEIVSWEMDDGFSSSRSIEYGDERLMIRPGADLETESNSYCFFIISYPIDTMTPENQGLYMLEVYEASYDGEWEAWQNRMRAGIHIVE